MRSSVRATRKALETAGHHVTDVGLFRSTDPYLLGSIVGLAFGATVRGGAAEATGKALDSILKLFAPNPRERRGLPHLVLVSVERDGVHLYASDRRWTVGTQLATFSAGEFSCSVDLYPGLVELILDSDHLRVVLKGKWGPVSRSCIRVSRLADKMSKGGSRDSTRDRNGG